MTHPLHVTLYTTLQSLDSLILIIGELASHLFVVNMFSGHNALNMPLHSQTNHQADHKTSGDKLGVSSAT